MTLTFDPLTLIVCSLSTVTWSNKIWARFSNNPELWRFRYWFYFGGGMGASAILDFIGSEFSQFCCLRRPNAIQ